VSSQTIAVERRRRRGLVIAFVALYSWVAGHFSTFTWPAAVATFIPGAVGLAATTRLRGSAVRRTGLRRTGWVAWAVVIGAIVALEAYGFFAGSSASGHPTISNIVNHGLHTNETRALAFFGWLALGKWLLGR
jgi:hypothetical protein